MQRIKTLYPSRPRSMVYDSPNPAPGSPVALTIKSLSAWPDDELYRLERGLAAELLRRRAARSVALPVVEVMDAVFGEEGCLG